MTRPVPNAVLVMDVNVLIDAVSPDSPRHGAAIRTMSQITVPAYLSDTVLRTTANKLLEFGADETAVNEYVEMLMNADDYGAPLTVLEDVPVTQYDIVDRYGRADYEDATVVSLMDAAEAAGSAPALLISNDGPLRDWCTEHGRLAARPEQLEYLMPVARDELLAGTYHYLSRKMFTAESVPRPETTTRPQSTAIVTRARKERELRARYPEMFDDEAPSASLSSTGQHQPGG